MLPLLLSSVSHFAAAPTTTADCVASQKSTFFGLETWYRYLTVTYDSTIKSCSITSFNQQGSGKAVSQQVLGSHSPFLLIGLAVVDDLLRVAGLVAVAFVIVGAINYITSQGNSDGTAKAQQTVINALIGVAISVIAVTLVSFIGSQLGS